MKKFNLPAVMTGLVSLGAVATIEAYGPDATSASTRYEITLPTTSAVAPTIRIVAAPVIDPSAEFFLGTGDGSAGAWVKP